MTYEIPNQPGASVEIAVDIPDLTTGLRAVAEDTEAQGTDLTLTLASTIDDVANQASSITDDVPATLETWEPLLNKINGFCTVVDKLTEVRTFPLSKSASSLIAS